MSSATLARSFPLFYLLARFQYTARIGFIRYRKPMRLENCVKGSAGFFFTKRVSGSD